MKKKNAKEFKPIIFNSYEEAYEYEADVFSVFPILDTNKKVIGYRLWSEEDKNYLRDIISEELYWEGYDNTDFDLIKGRYNYPYHIAEEICYGISLIENYVEEILL